MRTLIELLVEKGIMDKGELMSRTKRFDGEMHARRATFPKVPERGKKRFRLLVDIRGMEIPGKGNWQTGSKGAFSPTGPFASGNVVAPWLIGLVPYPLLIPTSM